MADHPELVSGKKYTEDFKKAILDCYNYDFSSSVSTEEKSQNSVKGNAAKRSAQRSRIKKILKNYVNWDDKKEKKENKIRFINKASEAMRDNPFQRFYRFCRYIPVSAPSYYLHIIAALSPLFDRIDNDEFSSNKIWGNLLRAINIISLSYDKKKSIINFFNGKIKDKISKNYYYIKLEDAKAYVEKLGLKSASIQIEKIRNGIGGNNSANETDNIYLRFSIEFVQCLANQVILFDGRNVSSPSKKEHFIVKIVDVNNYIHLLGLEKEQVIKDVIEKCPKIFDRNVADKDYCLRYSISSVKKIPKELHYYDGNKIFTRKKYDVVPPGFNVTYEEAVIYLRSLNLDEQYEAILIDAVRRDFEYVQNKGEGTDNYLNLAANSINLSEEQKDYFDELRDTGIKISARKLDENDSHYFISIDDVTTEIRKFGLKENDESILIAALHKCLNESFFSNTYFGGKEKTPGAHLSKLEKMGLLSRKWSPGNSGHKRNAYWYLPQTTIDKLINEGCEVDQQFEHHLHSALDFFSRYYAFGEIGVYLLDRLGGENNSPFRFRHEYFMQSLCDFHMIDLLNAIEQKKWCLIKYRHGIAEFETKLLCYPLQIRVGNRNGREHLMFYDPIRHCYSALRIEFIVGITYYYEEIVINALSGKNDNETIQREIENSRDGLKYLWGVATPSLPETKQENNAKIRIEPKHITMQIRCDPKKEYYIRNRLYRECRHGTVTELPEEDLLRFDIDVASPNELIPWIRSFYTRIVKLEGVGNSIFTLENDLSQMQKILNSGELASKDSDKPQDRWSVPEEILNILGDGEEADGHELIFSEIFSIYYYIFADMFTDLTMNVSECSELQFKRTVSNKGNSIIEKYNNRVGEATTSQLSRELKKIFLENNFFIKKKTNGQVTYSPRYKTDRQLNFYREVLPLSNIEKRWLATIIKDPKIYLFLNENEVTFLSELFSKDESNPKPLPIEHIVCYDRNHAAVKNTNESRKNGKTEISKEQHRIMSAVLEGIRSKKLLGITYRDNHGKFITGKYAPAVIEYSKRNNRLQGYFLKKGQSRGQFKIFNFSQIRNISITDSEYDPAAAEAEYDKMIEENTAMVKFEFIDERNLADRILTEFSPWKRECVKDGNHYTIKLYYRKGQGNDKGEERDIVIRLMSFGGYLRFADMREGSVGRQIKERVDSQLELLQERSIIKDDGDSR